MNDDDIIEKLLPSYYFFEIKAHLLYIQTLGINMFEIYKEVSEKMQYIV